MPNVGRKNVFNMYVSVERGIAHEKHHRKKESHTGFYWWVKAFSLMICEYILIFSFYRYYHKILFDLICSLIQESCLHNKRFIYIFFKNNNKTKKVF